MTYITLCSVLEAIVFLVDVQSACTSSGGESGKERSEGTVEKAHYVVLHRFSFSSRISLCSLF